MKKFLAYLSLCFTFSLLTVIIVAFACHLIRFRPNRFMAGVLGSREAVIHDANEDLFLASLPSDVEVQDDNGLGFRRVEIGLNPSRLGPRGIIRRHYLTTLGWPQKIFSNGSPWLGRYRESDIGLSNVDDWLSVRIMTGGSSTVFHWSGILFDTLTFGLPICAAAMWLRGSKGWPSVTVRRALTMTAVAWWLGLAIPALGIFDYVYCATGSRTPKGVLPEISSTSLGICKLIGERRITIADTYTMVGGYSGTNYVGPGWYQAAPIEFVAWRKVTIQVTDPAEFALQTGSDPIPLPAAGSKYSGLEVCGFAMSVRTQVYRTPLSDHPDEEYQTVFGESMSAGWPMEAFKIGDSTYPIMAVSDLSHLDVQWLPWLANVGVLSAGLAIICYPVMRIIRRWRRVAPGQCTTCRYPLNGSAICPECGWANAGSAKN